MLNLSEKEKIALDMRESGCSFKEIGNRLNVNMSQANAIYRKAFHKRGLMSTEIGDLAARIEAEQNLDNCIHAVEILCREGLNSVRKIERKSEKDLRNIKGMGVGTLKVIDAIKRDPRYQELANYAKRHCEVRWLQVNSNWITLQVSRDGIPQVPFGSDVSILELAIYYGLQMMREEYGLEEQ